MAEPHIPIQVHTRFGVIIDLPVPFAAAVVAAVAGGGQTTWPMSPSAIALRAA
ncbi:MAG: hypothetical protein IPI28_03325 [Candidatus Omnitrophica bacterium]|nr:hypothetical protein [Candidatus Omnitrophota bacterium]